MRSHACDVLVVGGGGAALRAAIAAKEADPSCRVLLVTKGILGRSGLTANACSDRMAFHATLDHTEPGEEAWRFHAGDIYAIGGSVSDYDLAAILAKGSKDAFWYLSKLGVPFALRNGLPDQFVTDGSVYARACYTGPKTAVHIEEALLRRFHELDIAVVEETAVYRLVKREGRIVGAFGIGAADEPVAFHAGAVILATGGAGDIFRHNVFFGGATGDGLAIALEAGASLVNMEFIQIGLCSVKTKLACSGSLMRAAPRLLNERGEEFLRRYFASGSGPDLLCNTIFEKGASWPVSYEHATHLIDVAVFHEIARGGKVYLDYRENPRGFEFAQLSERNRARFVSEAHGELSDSDLVNPIDRLRKINPASIQWLAEREIDLEAGDAIEIVPAIQHFQGGIRIRTNAETQVPGLFAAGECAGGQHGANRPGGNSLMDCQVFGRIAGESAARFAAERTCMIPEDELDHEGNILCSLRCAEGSLGAAQAAAAIRETMSRNLSVVRTAEGMNDALDRLENMKASRIVPGDGSLASYFETKAMLITAEAVTLAALERDESRGPHLRFDRSDDLAPTQTRPEWARYLVISLRDGAIELNSEEPVRPAK